MTPLRPLIQQLSLLCDSILQELDRMERGETGEPVNGVSIVPVVEAQGSLVPVEAVKAIAERPKVPTQAYNKLWNDCRGAVGLGPETQMGRHSAIFKALHGSAWGNVLWAARAIVDFFQSDEAAKAGYSVARFKYDMDRLLLESKQRAQREEVKVAQPGVPGDEPASPTWIAEHIRPWLEKLKSKARGFGSKGE